MLPCSRAMRSITSSPGGPGPDGHVGCGHRRVSRGAGANPQPLDELVAAGKIEAIPADPAGVAFGYDAERGRVYLQRASKLWRAQSEEKKREAQ